MFKRALDAPPTRPEPFQFQTEGDRWLRSVGRGLLADDPGMGKSRTALMAARGRTLVVPPAMLVGTWEDEIAKWAPNREITIVPYTTLWRRPELLNIEWDTVIADECHHLKNRKAQQTLPFIQSLKAHQLFLLTGTPVVNWAHEIYVPLRLLHPGDKRFTSYWRWLEEWFDVNEQRVAGGRTVKAIGGLHKGASWEDFREQNGLNTKMLRRIREEHLLDLPELTESIIRLPMVPDQRWLYNTLKADFIAWLEQQGERKEIVAWTASALHIKLIQIQTGIPTVEPTWANIGVGSNKLNAVQELLDDRRGTTTVLFCHFRNTATALVRLCESMGFRVGLIWGGDDDRQEIVRRFQKGELDILVGTLSTLSEGVTLTKADCAIFVERSWRPTTNEQARRRLHRIGQTRPVHIITLITEKALDDHMTEVLKTKTDQTMPVMRATEFKTLL